MATAIAGCTSPSPIVSPSRAATPSGGPSTQPVEATRTAQPGSVGGFVAEPVLTGLDRPTAVRFGADGRIWVAQKAGLVTVFEGADDTEPRVVDLRERVLDQGNRGLLGLELDATDADAAFVLYTFNGTADGDTPPWPDQAPDEEPPPADCCVASGVLSRAVVSADRAEVTVLIHEWCHRAWMHPPGGLARGPDGSLYAASGDGGYMRRATEVDPLAMDPSCHPGPFAARASAADREPGEWRGAIVAFAPEDLTSAVRSEAGDARLVEDGRVVAFGFRNPFRMAFRPGTSELWVSEAGWHTWEEIDVVADAADAAADDFGWPCREGPDAVTHLASDEGCLALASSPGSAIDPWLTYGAPRPVSDRDPPACTSGPTAISSIGFASAGAYPRPYDGAVFFSDFVRACLFAAPLGDGGRPDATRAHAVLTGIAAVDLQVGPTGELFAVDVLAGTVVRLRWTSPLE